MRRLRLLSSMVFALGCAFVLAASAQAVVIYSGNGQGNTTAPAGNTVGWEDMAVLSDGSAVYLGNRWMITANHVGDSGSVTFTDGRTFDIVPGTDVTLTNPASLYDTSTTPATPTIPDLRMFELAADPNLPTLQITGASPASGAQVMMIGDGLNRSANMIGYQVTETSAGNTATAVWNPTTLPNASAFGFGLLATSSMRWGYNQVNSGGLTGAVVQTGGTSFTFSTTFDRPGIPYEAQAAPGDSGGGVFTQVNGAWQLTGIMDALQASLPNQPGNSVVFGEQTLSIDLASYRSQILSIMAPAPWQNHTNPLDVDNSGSVTPEDALLIINLLTQVGPQTFPAVRPSGTDSLDVNGDGIFSNADALDIINYLVTGHNNVVPMTQAVMVPEPGSATLAAIGVLMAAIAWRGTLARRKRAAG